MTPERTELIRQSWEQVKPIADDAAELFYGKLFELDPSLRNLFSGDMQQQGRKLMAAINVAVKSLDRFDSIEKNIRDLGARHHHYGVQDHHYVTVANALLWTLQQGLGDQFTPDVRAAWVEMYQRLSTAMQAGARDQAANDSSIVSTLAERCRLWISNQFAVLFQPGKQS